MIFQPAAATAEITISARRHGVTPNEMLYIINNPVEVHPESDKIGEDVYRFIGFRNANDNDLYEVLVKPINYDRTMVIYHAQNTGRRLENNHAL